MLETAFTAMVNKASPWVINILLLAVAAVIMVWVISTIGLLKKNIYAQNITEKYIELQKTYNDTNNENMILNEKCRHSRTIQAGLRGAYSELKYLLYLFSQGQDIQEQATILLKSITDRITSDIKFVAGEIHRCAIWTPKNQEKLEMLVASAGFPDYYRIQRSLVLDASVAGRCFRTKTSLCIPDVDQDRDFRHTPGQAHKYKSLICVPLVFGDICLGIITVDGKEENAFNSEDVETVEAYSEIATMVRMMQISSYYNYSGGKMNGESM